MSNKIVIFDENNVKALLNVVERQFYENFIYISPQDF